MNAKLALLLSLGSVVLASCGGEQKPLLVSADGSLQVVFSADAKWLQEEGQKEMESALARFADIDLVYAHNDPMAYGAHRAAQQAERPGIRFVGIDALPREGVAYVQRGELDATLQYATCGAEAVDIAVLIVNGVKVQKDIVLGTRLFTRANVASGGEPIAAPGDAVIAELRRDNAAILSRKTTDEHWVAGVSQCNLGEPYRVQMNADIALRAKAYPAIEVQFKDAQNDADKQRAQVEEFIVQKVNVILISPKESVTLVPAVNRAMEKGIPVVVIDRKLGGDNYTCFVGADNVAIGRAAGAQVRKLLGGKGRIVEIKGLMTSSPAQERHRGFVEALGLAEPR